MFGLVITSIVGLGFWMTYYIEAKFEQAKSSERECRKREKLVRMAERKRYENRLKMMREEEQLRNEHAFKLYKEEADKLIEALFRGEAMKMTKKGDIK